MPAHYMKQFHIKYADREKLAARVRRAGVADWSALHTRKGRMYRDENPDLPVLEPWRNTTANATQRAVFDRNPYFHRVDPEGRQLPYIDQVIATFGSTEIIPAETAAGQSDLQARYIEFDNYTVLRQSETAHDYEVRLWTEGTSSGVALYPNLNVADQGWNALMNDVRFRRALSLGLDRHELNEQLYFGLAKPGNNTVLKESPLYEPIYDRLWTAHDPDKANKLLDSIGLAARNGSGVRLMPDGRPMELVVESAGERMVETDAMELVRYHWADLGIKVFVRSLQRDLIRRRYLNGQTKMTISNGLDIGLATADSNPEELAPVSTAQANWPVWGQYYETRGKAGTKAAAGPCRDASRPLSSMAHLADHGRAARHLGANADALCRSGVLDRNCRRDAAAGRGQSQASQRAGKGALLLATDSVLRCLPARYVLFRERLADACDFGSPRVPEAMSC